MIKTKKYHHLAFMQANPPVILACGQTKPIQIGTNIIIFVLISTDVVAIEVLCTFHQNQPSFLKTELEAGKHFPTSNHRNLPIASIHQLSPSTRFYTFYTAKKKSPNS